MPTIHAEIEYVDKERNGMKIHSDVCPDDCDFANIDKEYRKYIHALLDEWLDKSNGTCGFYIKEESYHFDMHYGDK